MLLMLTIFLIFSQNGSPPSFRVLASKIALILNPWQLNSQLQGLLLYSMRAILKFLARIMFAPIE